jgi:hypothetical protein
MSALRRDHAVTTGRLTCGDVRRMWLGVTPEGRRAMACGVS